MKKKLCYLIVTFLICAVSGCGGMKTSSAADETTGTLDPDSGPVLATIGGEDFHYATRYLIFRDLCFYEEDPAADASGFVLGFKNYGEIALGYELLYREAMETGFEIPAETVKKHKENFYRGIGDGYYLREMRENDGSAGELTAAADRMEDRFTAIKAECGLKSDKDLADLTYPIYAKGSVAADYWTQIRQEALGDNIDPAENRAFWEELYSELKEKYNVEYVMEF